MLNRRPGIEIGKTKKRPFFQTASRQMDMPVIDLVLGKEMGGQFVNADRLSGRRSVHWPRFAL